MFFCFWRGTCVNRSAEAGACLPYESMVADRLRSTSRLQAERQGTHWSFTNRVQKKEYSLRLPGFTVHVTTRSAGAEWQSKSEGLESFCRCLLWMGSAREVDQRDSFSAVAQSRLQNESFWQAWALNTDCTGTACASSKSVVVKHPHWGSKSRNQTSWPDVASNPHGCFVATRLLL